MKIKQLKILTLLLGILGAQIGLIAEASDRRGLEQILQQQDDPRKGLDFTTLRRTRVGVGGGGGGGAAGARQDHGRRPSADAGGAARQDHGRRSSACAGDAARQDLRRRPAAADAGDAASGVDQSTDLLCCRQELQLSDYSGGCAINPQQFCLDRGWGVLKARYEQKVSCCILFVKKLVDISDVRDVRAISNAPKILNKLKDYLGLRPLIDCPFHLHEGHLPPDVTVSHEVYRHKPHSSLVRDFPIEIYEDHDGNFHIVTQMGKVWQVQASQILRCMGVKNVMSAACADPFALPRSLRFHSGFSGLIICPLAPMVKCYRDRVASLDVSQHTAFCTTLMAAEKAPTKERLTQFKVALKRCSSNYQRLLKKTAPTVAKQEAALEESIQKKSSLEQEIDGLQRSLGEDPPSDEIPSLEATIKEKQRELNGISKKVMGMTRGLESQRERIPRLCAKYERIITLLSTLSQQIESFNSGALTAETAQTLYSELKAFKTFLTSKIAQSSKGLCNLSGSLDELLNPSLEDRGLLCSLEICSSATPSLNSIRCLQIIHESHKYLLVHIADAHGDRAFHITHGFLAENPRAKVSLLTTAGSNTRGIAVHSIVIPQFVCALGHRKLKLLDSQCGLSHQPQMVVVIENSDTVTSLLEETTAYNGAALDLGRRTVDMESFHCAQACHPFHTHCQVVQVISDLTCSADHGAQRERDERVIKDKKRSFNHACHLVWDHQLLSTASPSCPSVLPAGRPAPAPAA